MKLQGRLALELIGTYFLMLVIAMVTVHQSTITTAALAIGAILLALVYAFGPHCWAHFNPAMTLAFCLRGTTPFRELAPYTIAQCLGAVLAVFTQSLLISAGHSVEPVAIEASRSVQAMGGLVSVFFAALAMAVERRLGAFNAQVLANTA